MARVRVMARISGGIALGLALVCAPGLALADGGIDAGLACDPTTLWCSNAQVPRSFAYSGDLPVGIDTHWMPPCPGNPDLHCSEHKLQVRAVLSLVPLASGSPSYAIKMPGPSTLLDGTWPDEGVLRLSAVRGPAAGSFQVAYGLRPELVLYMDTPVFTGEIPISAAKLLPLLPQSQQPFQVSHANSAPIEPWGFDKVEMPVNGADLQGSQLFAVSFEQLGKLAGSGGFNDIITGSFSMNAAVTSVFTYQTSGITVQPSKESLLSHDGSLELPGPFMGAIDSVVGTTGHLSYSGEVEVLPVIHITSVGSFGIKLDYPTSVGVKHSFGSGAISITFPEAPVHMPLPKVGVSVGDVDFGAVSKGGEASRSLVITNNGELGARVFGASSSAPQFKVPNGELIVQPGGSVDLALSFVPSKAGLQTAVVTVSTNDPDLRVFSFTTTGEGVEFATDAGNEPSPDGGADALEDGSADTSLEGADSGGQVLCVPGQQIPCACPGGLQGAQACNGDGAGYGECKGCGEGGAAAADGDSGCGCRLVPDRGERPLLAFIVMGIVAMGRRRTRRPFRGAAVGAR